jgi:hypothetical protein
MEAAGIGVAVPSTLKFKAANEPVKKTDRHGAAAFEDADDAGEGGGGDEEPNPRAADGGGT